MRTQTLMLETLMLFVAMMLLTTTAVAQEDPYPFECSASKLKRAERAMLKTCDAPRPELPSDLPALTRVTRWLPPVNEELPVLVISGTGDASLDGEPIDPYDLKSAAQRAYRVEVGLDTVDDDARSSTIRYDTLARLGTIGEGGSIYIMSELQGGSPLSDFAEDAPPRKHRVIRPASLTVAISPDAHGDHVVDVLGVFYDAGFRTMHVVFDTTPDMPQGLVHPDISREIIEGAWSQSDAEELLRESAARCPQLVEALEGVGSVHGYQARCQLAAHEVPKALLACGCQGDTQRLLGLFLKTTRVGVAVVRFAPGGGRVRGVREMSGAEVNAKLAKMHRRTVRPVWK